MPETITFIHQCIFLPTMDTIYKATNNNKLIRFPHLTSKLVRKYLPDSTATAKGHMNRTKRGLRSTTKSQTSKAEEIEKDYRLKPNKDAEVEIFIGATIGENSLELRWTKGARRLVWIGTIIVTGSWDPLCLKPLRSDFPRLNRPFCCIDSVIVGIDKL